MYLTNFHRSLYLENSDIMFVDLTACDHNLVTLELNSLHMVGNIVYGYSMKNIIKELTLYTGRMIIPPVWTQEVSACPVCCTSTVFVGAVVLIL